MTGSASSDPAPNISGASGNAERNAATEQHHGEGGNERHEHRDRRADDHRTQAGQNWRSHFMDGVHVAELVHRELTRFPIAEDTGGAGQHERDERSEYVEHRPSGVRALIGNLYVTNEP